MKNKKETALKELIQDYLNSEKAMQLMESAMDKVFAEAVKESLDDGMLKNALLEAMEGRIKESLSDRKLLHDVAEDILMVVAAGRADSSVLDRAALVMEELPFKEITIDDLFERYIQHMAVHVDCTHLFLKDRTHYSDFPVYCDLSRIKNESRGTCHAVLEFTSSECEGLMADAGYHMSLEKKEDESGYRLYYEDPGLDGIMKATEFGIYLLRMQLQHVRVLEPEDNSPCLSKSVDVTPAMQPFFIE